MFSLSLIEEDIALHLNGFIAEIEEVPLDELVATIQPYDVRQEVREDEIFDEYFLDPFKGITHRYITEKRKIELETLRAWESGYDNNEKRATFPVRNWRGQLVGLVGRGIHEYVLPPSKNYWGFKKGRFLFGENKIVPGTSLIVVEGPLDAISVWQSLAKENLLNKYSVVGLFGSDATMMQIRKIVRLSEDVILFLDNDSAGWHGQQRLGKILQHQLLVREVKYPKPVGGDPDELVRSGVVLKPLLENARLFVLTD